MLIWTQQRHERSPHRKPEVPYKPEAPHNAKAPAARFG
jgi:hypothetical protein